jgi:hypothetical protein
VPSPSRVCRRSPAESTRVRRIVRATSSRVSTHGSGIADGGERKGDANEKEGAQGPAKSNNPADFGNDKIVLVQFEDGSGIADGGER